MARKLIGTAVTDENGEATITYTGTGAGKLNIVAESGTFVSETFALLDTQFHSHATQRKYWNTANALMSYNDTAFTIDMSDVSGYTLCSPYITDNFPESWNDKITASTCFKTPLAIEFKVLDVTNNSQIALYVDTKMLFSGGISRWGANVGDTSKIEIDEEGTVTVYKNGVLQSITDTCNTGTVRLPIRVNGGHSVTFDNFKIYSI